MPAIAVFVFVLLITAERTLAFPSGAGGTCEPELPGVVGVQSPHLADPTSFAQLSEDEFPPLDAYGVHVQLNGVVLNPNSIDGSAFRSGTDEHILSVVSMTGRPFKGVLLRLTSFTFGDVSDALIPMDDDVLQESHACSLNQPYSVGLTHTNSKDKQRVSAYLTYEQPPNSNDLLMLEVTIVVSLKEWYYKPYFLIPVTGPRPAEQPRTLPEAKRKTQVVSHTTADVSVEGDIGSSGRHGAAQAGCADCNDDCIIDSTGESCVHRSKSRARRNVRQNEQWFSKSRG